MQEARSLTRDKLALIEFAGPAQTGGALDPVSLAQLRFPTFWAVLDLKLAFDTAILPGMKVAVAEAGIGRLDWLLLDDIMDQDVQCLSLHGLLSPVFKLCCGTAQGRKFSVAVFKSLLIWLSDEVYKIVPDGSISLLPDFAGELLAQSQGRAATTGDCWSASSLDLPKDVSKAIPGLAPVAGSMHQPNGQAAVMALCSLRSSSERQLCLELLGEGGFVAAQHVDDATVPCSSCAHVRAIMDATSDSACGVYA